ncbi:DUF7261 family protein [Halomarina pelagica]|uniref:DUF7261 family protein n=1 Tax=Halomarina pelagica TaxID=2961599 RepID=UPI0020C50FC3|nr:hypothetical protein [Halomarina sp. BND7]
MADVSERGQMLLVAGLTLATAFVALALVLNTAIYTENLSTRTSDPGASEAIRFAEAVEVDLGDAVTYVNEREATYPDRRAAFEDVVASWSDATADSAAIDGVFTAVSLSSVEQGTRVVDGNASDGLTNATGAGDWTVVADGRVRAFEMRVDPPTGRSLVVEFANASATWTTTVERVDSSTVEVRTTHPDATVATCTVAASGGATIDVSRETVAGDGDPRYCRALDYASEIRGAYDLELRDADAVSGTFELVANRAVDDGPSTETVLYGATVSATYDSGRVTARWADLRIAPGEVGR